MLDILKLTIYSIPVPKARPRTVLRNGKVRTYTPKKTSNFENELRTSAILAMKNKPVSHNALYIYVQLGLPIPNSWSKIKTKKAIDNIIKPTTRPDIDNYLKSILDGLNDVVFKDDSQVVELAATKTYMAIPRTIIHIKEI